MTLTDSTTTSIRRDRLHSDAFVARLRDVALRSLRRMYRPQKRVFAFRLRRTEDGLRLEGVSNRYTAMALIGLANEPAEVVADVLAGQSLSEVCGQLIERVSNSRDLGEVALALWCARMLGHPAAGRALGQLRAMSPHERNYPTVELSWALTAQLVPGSSVRDEQLSDAIARRLVASFQASSALFPHWPVGARPSRFRAHVTCYADLVYPIQALAHYHLARRDEQVLSVARRCATRMCELQGPVGQWWWHYDVRTGRVIERFPVYAVHQDAMAPMALFALEEACGDNEAFRTAVDRGLEWLEAAPELRGNTLVDERAPAIWRKVGRHEPGRLVRGMQAGFSRLHRSLRLSGADRIFPPGRIDYESRPYHMGWILYAWRQDGR